MVKKTVTTTIDIELWQQAKKQKLNLSRFFNSKLEEELSEKGKNKSRRAIILAAGKEKRLYPLTKSKPKPLISVGGKKLIDWQISNLKKLDVKDIIVVTGHGEKQIKRHLGKSVKYIFNPFYASANILASLWLAGNFFEKGFILSYGDIIYDKKILEQLLETKEDIAIAVIKKKLTEESEKVLVEKEEVKMIGKQAPSSKATGEFAGLAKFSAKGAKQLLDVMNEMAHEDTFSEAYFTDAIERLVFKDVKIKALVTSLDWGEIDFVQDIKFAEKHLMQHILKK